MKTDNSLLRLAFVAQILLLLVKFVLRPDLHWCIVLLPLWICLAIAVLGIVLLLTGLILERRLKRKKRKDRNG